MGMAADRFRRNSAQHHQEGLERKMNRTSNGRIFRSAVLGVRENWWKRHRSRRIARTRRREPVTVGSQAECLEEMVAQLVEIRALPEIDPVR